MSDMIEKVAKVLEPQAWAALGIGDTLAYKSRRTSSLRKARAAIEALREPTNDMVWAHEVPHYGPDEAREAWQAMIDAALAE
jgi:hypothetical protein